jgi:hypothetical protein
MAKSSKSVTNESEAFEIIELALNEIDLLARAFSLIDEACTADEEEVAESDWDELSLN